MPLGTQPPPTIPGSTATTTIAPPITTTHSSLPHQPLTQSTNYHVAPPIVNSLDTNLPTTVLPGSVVPPSQPAKVCFCFFFLIRDYL